MTYSHEVEHMCVVKKGPNHGPDVYKRQNQCRIFCNIGIGSTTAPTYDIDQSFMNILFYFMGHICRSLVIFS